MKFTTQIHNFQSFGEFPFITYIIYNLDLFELECPPAFLELDLSRLPSVCLDTTLKSGSLNGLI